jgi:two-component system response regulator PhoP
VRVLLVEDDDTIVRQVTEKLSAANFVIDSSPDGQDGLYRALEFDYNLAIIDLGLPKQSGLTVIEELRQRGNTMPILILTARGSWQDKVQGLNAGADDYLVKPFQWEELLARVQAMTRRASGYASNILVQGDISLNIETENVQVDNHSVNLTAFEYRLLEYFMLNPKKICSKMLLNDYLYGDSDDPDSNVIEVLVARLRQKLRQHTNYNPIETLRGRGYRLVVKL